MGARDLFHSRTRTAGGMVVLPAIALAGALLGLAEWGYHRMSPLPPVGEPGAAGPSLLGFLGLGVSVTAVPALLMALLTLGAWRWFAVGATWLAAFLPTTLVALAHLAHERRWSWFQPTELGAHYAKLLAVGLGIALAVAWCGATISRRLLGGSKTDLSRRRSLLWATLGLVTTATGPWLLQRALSPPPPRSPSGAAQLPDVLLLTIDTLRRDAVGAYGGPPTPALDRLIGSGVRADGLSPASWTRPAMAALFCGLPVTANGAGVHQGVNPNVAWWPEALQEAGYQTVAFITNPHLEPHFGFRRGFARFDHAQQLERLDPIAQAVWTRWLTRQLVERLQLDRGDHLARRAVRWFEAAPAGPWLVWVHFIDPHLPYFLRGPHGELSDPSPGAWVEPLRADLQDGAFRGLAAVRAGEMAASAEERVALRALYQREVLFVDQQIGALVAAATHAAGARGMLWIVAGDHGEEFFEHGGFEHGHSLHDEVLAVPVALGGAGLPAGAAIGGMKLQDVGPTLLGLLGLPPMAASQGSQLPEGAGLLAEMAVGRDRSQELREAHAGPLPCTAIPLLAEGMLYGPPQTRLIFADGLSVTRADSTGHAVAEQFCAAQPLPIEGEIWASDAVGASASPPLATVVPPDRLRLFGELWAWRAAARGSGPTVPIDAATRERLRSLGYGNF